MDNIRLQSLLVFLRRQLPGEWQVEGDGFIHNGRFQSINDIRAMLPESDFLEFERLVTNEQL